MSFQPQIPLDIHLQLAKKIRDEYFNAMYGKYQHQRFKKVLQFTLNNIRNYIPRDDELIQLLLDLVNRKSKIPYKDIYLVLSLLDSDFIKYPESFWMHYGNIYFK